MNCRENERYFYGYLTSRSQLPAGVAEHLDKCHDCKLRIERLRAELEGQPSASEDRSLLRAHLKLHADLQDQWISCRHVRPFLPALLVDELRVSALTPVTAHIEQCAQCRADLRRIQELDLSDGQLLAAAQFLADQKDQPTLSQQHRQVLQAISDCDTSGILTRMDSATQPSCDDAETVPHGPSIQVRYDRMHRRSRSVHYLVTGGIAVAAVFMIITLLPQRVSGNLQHVDRAVRSVSELHLERYSGNGQLLQEIWMSRSLGFKLYKQPQSAFFKDLRTGRVMQRQLESGSLTLSEGIREEDKYTSLLPFDQLKDLPARYEWNFKGDQVLDDGRKVQVYELDWAAVSPAMLIAKRWRGYLDPDTHLPYRIDWFEKVADDYELVTRLLVSYPSQAQCLERFKSEGFQRYLNADQAE